MNLHSDYDDTFDTFGSPEPLPPHFEPELQEIDRRLTAWSSVEQSSIPANLEQRVMERVLAELPAVSPLVEVTTRRRPHRAVIGRLGWSQLALAACFLFACLVAISFMRGPASPEDSFGPRVTFASDVSYLDQEEPTAVVDVKVAYLLNTAAMSSLDEVESELAMIFGEFEM